MHLSRASVGFFQQLALLGASPGFAPVVVTTTLIPEPLQVLDTPPTGVLQR